MSTVPSTPRRARRQNSSDDGRSRSRARSATAASRRSRARPAGTRARPGAVRRGRSGKRDDVLGRLRSGAGSGSVDLMEACLQPVEGGVAAAGLISSSCVPSSTMRPRSIVMMRSACRTVDRRWAITNTVRPLRDLRHVLLDRRARSRSRARWSPRRRSGCADR